MIDICLYRARVGTFNIKKIKQSVKLPIVWQLIHTYLLHCLLMAYTTRFGCFNYYPLNIFIVSIITFKGLYLNIINLSTYYFKLRFSFLLCGLSFLINIVYLIKLLLILIILSGDIELNPGPTCNFMIAHINARSILSNNKLEEVEDLLINYHNIDILAVTETHLDHTKKDDSIFINGYSVYRRDRNKNGGGVAIYCKNSIRSIRRTDLERNNIELLWVELYINDKKILVASCYRPPGQNINDSTRFLESLQSSLEIAIDEDSTSVILLGDLNDRCNTWTSPHTSSELKDRLVTLSTILNLTQLINQPTRGNHLLDIILTNTPDLFCDSGVYPLLPDFDHCPIYGKFNITYNSSKPYKKRIWKLDEGKYEDLNIFLNDKLHDYDLIFPNNDINACVKTLTDTIIEGMDRFIPSKEIRIKPKDKPWFTPNIRNLFRKCHTLHKRKNLTNNENDIERYQNARHMAKTAFRNARRDYYNNLNEKIENPETTTKTFWKLLKNIMNKNSSGIPTLNVNGSQIHDDRGKAEALNDFFVSQSTIGDNNDDLPPFTYVTDARLDQIIVTEEQVKQILLSLTTNKSTGPDFISNKLLKECADTLCGPLTYIFQLSLQQGIYPDSWKEAMITAIFKKIDPSFTKNYRPISLLSCISKVFEKVIFNHTYPYFIRNELLPDYNSGFRQDDGAINMIIAMLEEIYTGLDDHEDCLFVSLDISKAFDRVWHRGLLFKLKQLGISGSLLRWFTSYLDSRCQRVQVGGKNSSLKYINAGVPQGSILGPMLFLVYIYDMCAGLTSTPHQFADDTTLIYKSLDPISLNMIINEDLQKLSVWAAQWKVNFNPSKTFYMYITNKRNRPILQPIYLCGQQINESKEITTLGVVITNNLSWRPHISNLIAKASKRLLVLRRYKYILPRKALETLYISMIRPVLEYGDVIYDNCPLSSAQTLDQVQRQAALICTGGYRHSSYSKLLSELNWEPLHERRKSHKLTIFYKIKNKISPKYLYNLLPKTNETTYNLRNNNNIRPRYSRLSNSIKSFFPSTTRLWNNLPLTTQNAISLNTFKVLIRGQNKGNPYHRSCSGKPGIWLTRLRLGLSALNSHRFLFNFIDSPKCPSCHLYDETTLHYLFDCPTHQNARRIMYERLSDELGIETRNQELLCKTLLEGEAINIRNIKVLLNIIYDYMTLTGRFK